MANASCGRPALPYGSTILLSVLRFHSPLKYPWKLDVFAVGSYNLATAGDRPLPHLAWDPALERLGLAAYSIYLVHVHARHVFALLPIPDWAVLRLGFILAFAYAFYWLVEAVAPARAAGEPVVQRAADGQHWPDRRNPPLP